MQCRLAMDKSNGGAVVAQDRHQTAFLPSSLSRGDAMCVREDESGARATARLLSGDIAHPGLNPAHPSLGSHHFSRTQLLKPFTRQGCAHQLHHVHRNDVPSSMLPSPASHP
jgi:hypothetical protein